MALVVVLLPISIPLLYVAIGGSLLGICERLSPSKEKEVTGGTFVTGLILWPIIVLLSTGWICYHKICGRELADD